MGKDVQGCEGAGRVLVLKLGCGYVGTCDVDSLYTLYSSYKHSSLSIYIY